MRFFIVFAVFSLNSIALASIEPRTARTSEKTQWQLFKAKLRARTFTEIMSPALQNNPTSVPYPDGTQFVPMNAFNIFWVDYEFSKDLRLLYHQRGILTLAPNSDFQNMTWIGRDPRFGIRSTNFFNNPSITTAYDLYIQPGVTETAKSLDRAFEIGFRTNTSYAFEHSHWSIGAITEFTTGYFRSGGKKSNAYGFAIPWISYELSPRFSTQSYASLPFTRWSTSAWNQFTWDDPTPYLQNGFAMNVTDQIWASLLLNNYVTAMPSLNNTWVSLWVSLVLL